MNILSSCAEFFANMHNNIYNTVNEKAMENDCNFNNNSKDNSNNDIKIGKDSREISETINHFASSQVPAEILQKISIQLDIKTRINLRQVCASWSFPLNNDCKHIFYSIIDVRNILEFQPYLDKEYKHPLEIREDYRNLRAVVNLVGGWEKYRNLPEIDMKDASFKKRIHERNTNVTTEIIESSDLLGPIVRVKDEFGIIFRHYNNLPTNKNKICLGFILLTPKEQICSWRFSFGEGFSKIRMNRSNGPCQIDPALENEMTDLILKPIQVVRELLSRPAFSKKKSASFNQSITTQFKMKFFSDSPYRNFGIVLCDDKT